MMKRMVKWSVAASERHPVVQKASKFYWRETDGQILGQIDPNLVRLCEGWLYGEILVQGAKETKSFVFSHEVQNGYLYEEKTSKEQKIQIFIFKAEVKPYGSY